MWEGPDLESRQLDPRFTGALTALSPSQRFLELGAIQFR